MHTKENWFLFLLYGVYPNPLRITLTTFAVIFAVLLVFLFNIFY